MSKTMRQFSLRSPERIRTSIWTLTVSGPALERQGIVVAIFYTESITIEWHLRVHSGFVTEKRFELLISGL